MNTNSKLEAGHSNATDFLRALIILAFGCGIGLATNALREKPLAILDPKGPGALPEEPRIGVETLRELLSGKTPPLILDARSSGNFNAGHAAGAINVPEHDFLEYYNDRNLGVELQSAPMVVVMCDSVDCPSADRVAKMLRELHVPNVRVLQDGW